MKTTSWQLREARSRCLRLARERLRGPVIACLFAATLSTGVSGQQTPLQTIRVSGNIYLISGAGGNVVVQAGEQGILVVDTGTEARADEMLAAIREISDRPIRHVINTHIHADHTGGNAVIAGAGEGISGPTGQVGSRALVYAHENVMLGMTASADTDHPIPAAFWPLDTYFEEPMELYFNGESIQLLYVPNAHTNGDTMVYFRRSDVVVAGDIFLTTTFPRIDEASGGNINGIIDGLNRLIRYTIPGPNEEGGTLVVAGHGRVGDEYDVVVYRDMLTVIRDRVQALIDAGDSLDEVLAAHPAEGYEERYGADGGRNTTDEFIAAVYRGLQ